MIDQNNFNVTKQKKIEYKYMIGLKRKERFACYSFAFNSESTIYFFGQAKGKIKFCAFNNKNKSIQTFTGHTDLVVCIVWISKSNQLVSGCFDKTIIIWKQDLTNFWTPQFTLQGHNHWIRCIILNQNEDLLISGGVDKAIKFWKNENSRWDCIQTIDASFSVHALSLNNLEDKLISCGNDCFIQVIEHQQNKWVIIQSVKIEEFGFRLCFIDDNQFVFQPILIGYLQIFKFDKEQKQFIKEDQIQVENDIGFSTSFPCQFIQMKSILIAKHAKNVNIFQINSQGNLELIQSIQFKLYQIFGRLTNSGQYLITWNEDGREIEVWNFKQNE